jgi:hypothetical protein
LLLVAAIGIVGCSQVGRPSDSTASSLLSPRASVESPESSVTDSSTPAGVLRGELLVLGGPAGGPYDLWRFDGQQGWTNAQASSGATAIGRDASSLLLGGPSAIEVRALGTYAQPQPAEERKSPFGAPGTSVASIARSANGRIALVAVSGSEATFVVDSASGALGRLSAQPRQPFSPLVAWLKDDRVLALSVDDRQISRLAVIDPSSARMSLLESPTGARAFAVAPDGATIAVATEDAVYVGQTAAWISGATPAEAIDVPNGDVAWHLALSPDARRLAMLLGEVGDDGTVSSVREVAYELTAGGWQQVLEVELPFAFAAGQVWLD